MSEAAIPSVSGMTLSRSNSPLLDTSSTSMMASSSRPISQSRSPRTSSSPSLLDTSTLTDSSDGMRSSTSSSLLSPVTPQLQSPLLRSPTEIIQKVLVTSGGDDVSTIAIASQVCKELRSFIYENTDQALWRQIFLQHYDDPRSSGSFTEAKSSTDIDWKKKVQDRESVGRMFKDWWDDKFDEAAGHMDLIASTLLDMFLDLPPSETNLDPSVNDEPSNSTLLSTWLRSSLFSHLYRNCSLSETEPSLRPLSGQSGNPRRRSTKKVLNPTISRLHCLLPPEYNEDFKADREWRGYVREVVYSIKNYQKRNDWGPFTEEGKVDWTLVDAVSSVMMANAKDVIQHVDNSWRSAVEPMSYGVEPTRGWGFNDLRRPDDLAEGEVWDWAGVEGPWCGYYAFMDYADWVILNQPRLIFLNRQSSDLDLSTYHEAVGDLMRLDLKITQDPSKIATICPAHRMHSSSDHLPPIETTIPTSDLLPPIYFHGASIQHQNEGVQEDAMPSSAVRGVVRLTADNPPQVRWTMIIRYSGEDRWRLECVQVGGRGSKRGFFGVWMDASKGEHSPCGPAWYWKS
ncbi:uncharacterized protein IL334_006284 [Kwoniella shivajii]|uniref:F-box domain-containing protein n=1 Tax=Kwoniella shivajii TaxID=564305 RepID=A0ABZ1D5V4_9TREE|nr:hypothetical protein IL334_006284 [Kwoniella shivajii]